LALEAFRLYWLSKKEEKKEEGVVDFKTAKHSWEKVFDAYTDNYYGNDVETFADENNMTVEEVNKMSMDEIIDMARDTGVNYTDFAVLRQYFSKLEEEKKEEEGFPPAFERHYKECQMYTAEASDRAADCFFLRTTDVPPLDGDYHFKIRRWNGVIVGFKDETEAMAALQLELNDMKKEYYSRPSNVDADAFRLHLTIVGN